MEERVTYCFHFALESCLLQGHEGVAPGLQVVSQQERGFVEGGHSGRIFQCVLRVLEDEQAVICCVQNEERIRGGIEEAIFDFLRHPKRDKIMKCVGRAWARQTWIPGTGGAPVSHKRHSFFV